MKKLLPLLAILLLGSLALSAASTIAALPVSDLPSGPGRDNLYLQVKSLADQGWAVLHYDRGQVIAAVPESQFRRYPGLHRLADETAPLYLIGKLEGASRQDLASVGKVLLELDSAFLVESGLNEIEIGKLIRNEFSRLPLQPMRFSDTALRLSAATETRTSVAELVAAVNVTSVTSLLQGLQDLQTRYALANNRLQVAQWIQQQFQSFGVTDVQLQSFNWQGTQQYNVVATIPGTVYPYEYIIVGGHHDSRANDADSYTLAPGSDDNGSGTVAALETARVMMQTGYQPRCSVRFITFAAEEFGLWGSKDYATYADNTDLNIRLMINHDMLANNTHSPDQWQVRLMPYDGSLDHSAYAAQLTEQYTALDAYYGSANSGSSDSHPFWQHGFNVIYFFESDFSPVYHTSLDVIANLDPVYCTEVIKASVACSASFADMPAAPLEFSVRDAGTGTSIEATWIGYTDPTIDHYNVYQSATFGNWGTPTTTEGNVYTFNGLTEGQLYHFAVSTVDIFGNESYLVYASGTPHSVPLEPQNLTDYPMFDLIQLAWEPNSELDLSYYRVYRSQSEGVLGELVANIPGISHTYNDANVIGSHLYYYYSVCAVDTDGNASPFTQAVSSRPITLDQGVLIVDETENLGGTNPLQPNDIQVDSFYQSITQGFPVAELDLDDLAANLRLADLCVYSSILWHGNDFASMDYPYSVREVLEDYLLSGGNIFFSLYQPSMAFELNATYPETFGEGDFIHDVLGIQDVDYSNSARFNSAIPVHDQFPAVQIDPDKTGASLNGHILRVESIGSVDGCPTVYTYGSAYADDSPQGVMNDLPVGVLNLDYPGKVLTLSFPLYSLYEAHAEALVRYVFTQYFGEAYTSADDPAAPPAAAVTLSANHPNPFAGNTSFRVEGKDSTPLRVEIFNLRGQLVKTLFNGPAAKSLLLNWNGEDSRGEPVASGVFLLRASQGGTSVTRRMLLIR